MSVKNGFFPTRPVWPLWPLHAEAWIEFQTVDPECESSRLGRSLVLTRSNGRTIRLMTEAVGLASERAGAGGEGDWQDKGMGVASLIKGWGDKGKVTWTRDLMSVSEGVPGDSLVVMSMSKAQFGVIGVHGDWEQLTNSALVWLHKNSATRDAGTIWGEEFRFVGVSWCLQFVRAARQM